MDEKKDEKKVDNGLAAKVRKLEETVAKLGKRLEEVLGLDLDGDGKLGKFAVKIGLLLCGGLLIANTATAANTVIWNLRNSGDTANVAAIDEEGDMSIGTLTTTGNVSVGGTAAWVPSAAQAGAKNGAAVTAAIVNPKEFQVTLTIDDLTVPVTSGDAGTNWTGGIKIFDFPEGLLDVEAVLVSDVIMVATGGVAAAEGGDWALGTAVGSGPTLAGTAVDLCPATSCDEWVTTNSAFLAAGALFDGTATAKDCYFNVSVDGGDISGATTVMVNQATVRITGKICGDD
ncbi:MAG: hypothetical protein FJ276_37890 [Planctomycetes bacterium]|nr:hypothetical protein [Planctomycetota bacterium]